jgi:hypothetical protein
MAAIIELYANNAYSTLASSTTTTATTLTVVNGSSFPNPVSGSQFFRMTITGASSPNTVIEIVYVTARSGNTLTVVRGREGTSGVAWSLNDLCANEATAGTYNQFMQPYFGVDTGVTNAYVVSTEQNELAYYDGMPLTFYTLNTNTTTTPTLNLNGLGAKQIKRANGDAVAVNQIPANTVLCLAYSITFNGWLLQSPIGLQPAITGAATSIVNLDLTASRALVSDTNGKVAASGITAAELNYLAFATSNIQTQLNNKTDFTDFLSSLAGVGGWQKLSSGIIIQWGSANSIPAGSQTRSITLPIPWLNGYLAGVVSDVGGGCVPYGISAGTTNSTIRVYAPYAFLNGVTSNTTPQVRGTTSAIWIAIGN